MQALKGTAEEKQLLQRYVKQLDDQENRPKTVENGSDPLPLASFIEGLAG